MGRTAEQPQGTPVQAAKNKGGRPKAYNNLDELQGVIDAYFESCAGPYIDGKGQVVKDKDGEVMMNPEARPLTMAGLALALGISRMTLLRYEQQPEKYPEGFCDAVAHARARVEAYAEGRLYDRDGSNGAKFALSNNHEGWAEKQEVNTTSTLLLAGVKPEDMQKLLADSIANRQKRLASRDVQAESVEVIDVH